jgi:hypothetical protein
VKQAEAGAREGAVLCCADGAAQGGESVQLLLDNRPGPDEVLEAA